MSEQSRLLGLPPMVTADTRVLLLGSFPGIASLQAGQYYAHPRNQFWPLLSALTGLDLHTLPYADRWRPLLAAGFGVWDVYAACVRPGSLDSAIRAAKPNDFAALKIACPHLQKVGLNGREAGKFAAQLQALGWHALQLPSSSPAYAGMSFADKLKVWRDLLD